MRLKSAWLWLPSWAKVKPKPTSNVPAFEGPSLLDVNNEHEAKAMIKRLDGIPTSPLVATMAVARRDMVSVFAFTSKEAVELLDLALDQAVQCPVRGVAIRCDGVTWIWQKYGNNIYPFPYEVWT